MHKIKKIIEEIIKYLEENIKTNEEKCICNSIKKSILNKKTVNDFIPNIPPKNKSLINGLSSISSNKMIPLKNAIFDGYTKLYWKIDNGEYYNKNSNIGKIYLNGNMNAELIGPNDGYFKSEKLKLGIFLLEQNIFYKDHKHAAPELYLNLTNGIKLVIDLQLKGGFSAIYHAMNEEDVIRIMQHPLAMIETDGDPVSYGVGYPHPRSYGAFPRVLARYVRDLEVITLVEAIKKMTSMAADRIGHFDRGRIKVGTYADLVVFDFENIKDNATYTDPHRYPTGIDHVMINGKFAIKDGALTGERPGEWLKGPFLRK